MAFPSAALLKEHEQFLKRKADAVTLLASTEKSQNVDNISSQKISQKKSILGRSKTLPDFRTDYHSSNTSKQAQFLILKNIVEKLQERFFSGQTDRLILDEIIKEYGLIINSSDKHWLASQALLSNERIAVDRINDTHRFVYKPPFNLNARKRSSLLTLLKSRHDKCEGALTVENVQDSIPKERADNMISRLIESGDIVKVKSNKTEVLFYTDNYYKLPIHPEFIHLWNELSVEHLSNEKIQEFIEKEGHYGLKTSAPKQAQLPTKISKSRVQRRDMVKHNQHVAHQLVDYSNSTNKK
ncbi:unnamed protein product [Rotaria sp. Silwood2]|nr:unnamed protein product [Rotaria sp. Silwood2]CAF2990457.1 unnamed protein product [Rotaria sp. Silwood2]CAF4295451.1 unnamed protein product [Rotaria sp. Silwood2]CAF4333937.1 unnamed protein product [Rotaria sp. Silwood2]CAF4791908.1 unnamed protein product [Rotaria sp. Silwood2]